MNGILLVDKPKGISSFDVIRKLRRQLLADNEPSFAKASDGFRAGALKIGHAGTLDPMATGLLIILVGNACKQASQFLKLDKTYEAEITLGAVSDTDDAEGAIAPVESRKSKAIKPSKSQIIKVANDFIGEQNQVPPQHSAIKVSGQRAYKLARAGKKVNLQPRLVTIYQLQITSYKYPKLKLKCRVSSGTYIRSLARDLGDKLGTGGYLSSLKRTSVGRYMISDCVQVETIDLAAIKKNIITVEPKALL